MRLITTLGSSTQVRSLLVVVSIGLTLSACGPRETRLLTVEQVKARQAAVADKELKKQQQNVARLKAKADQMAAKADQERQKQNQIEVKRQAAKEKVATQAASNFSTIGSDAATVLTGYPSGQ